MTKKTFLVVTAAVLETLAEVGPMREGPAYAALMGVVSLDEFQTILGFLQRDGYVTRGSGFLVTITDKGRELVGELAQAKTAKVA